MNRDALPFVRTVALTVVIALTAAGCTAPASSPAMPAVDTQASRVAPSSPDGTTPADTTSAAADDANALPPATPVAPPAPPTLAELGVTATTTGTFESVAILDVGSPFGQPLWVAHTTGLRSYDPGSPHVVAVLTRTDGRWHVIDRLDLGGDPKASTTPDPDAYFGPDHLGPGSVARVTIEPSRLWLTVDGGIGAHSSSFAVLSFDGRHLKLEAHASNSFPGVGRVEDLNGDGIGEVVIDRTDAYVFCYACGVRAASVGVLKWQDSRLQPIALQPIADADADDARRSLDAVAGGFWTQAAALAQAALQSGPNTPAPSSRVPAANRDTLMDNAMLIDANLEARRSLTGPDNPYPLLHQVFLGDWADAVGLLRAHAPEELFAVDSPLVSGTPAEGQATILAERIANAAGPALLYGPKIDAEFDPAPIHFLRGWSAWLAAPGDAAARADIAKAAELAPTDTLFTTAAAWIASQP